MAPANDKDDVFETIAKSVCLGHLYNHSNLRLPIFIGNFGDDLFRGKILCDKLETPVTSFRKFDSEMINAKIFSTRRNEEVPFGWSLLGGTEEQDNFIRFTLGQFIDSSKLYDNELPHYDRSSQKPMRRCCCNCKDIITVKAPKILITYCRFCHNFVISDETKISQLGDEFIIDHWNEHFINANVIHKQVGYYRLQIFKVAKTTTEWLQAWNLIDDNILKTIEKS